MRRTREDTRGAPSVLPIHQHKIGILLFVALCSLFVPKYHKIFIYAFSCDKQKCKVVSLNLGHPVELK